MPQAERYRHPVYSYRRGQVNAREAANRISKHTAEKIDALLNRYILQLVDRMTAGSMDFRTAQFGRANAVTSITAKLAEELRKAIGEARDLTYFEVMAAHQEGLEAALRAAATSATAGDVSEASALALGVNAVPTQMLGVYAKLSPVGHWHTLLPPLLVNVAEEIDDVMTRGLIEGVSPSKIQYALRKYVFGRENADKVFGWMGPGTAQQKTQALNSIRYNARRIAYSEIYNARAEAEILNFAADPLIKAVRWSLSPYRGPYAETDECDLFASADWYGLGPGVFPVDKVPFPPHPFDRCERKPVWRPMSEANQPKPKGELKVMPQDLPSSMFRDKQGNPLPAWKEDRIRRRAFDILNYSDRTLAAVGLREISEAAVGVGIATTVTAAAQTVTTIEQVREAVQKARDAVDEKYAMTMSHRMNLDNELYELTEKSKQAVVDRDLAWAKVTEKKGKIFMAHEGDPDMLAYWDELRTNAEYLKLVEEHKRILDRINDLAAKRRVLLQQIADIEYEEALMARDALFYGIPRAKVDINIRMKKKPFAPWAKEAVEELEDTIPARWQGTRTTDMTLKSSGRANGSAREIKMSQMYDTEFYFKETVFHEYGHSLEEMHPELHEAAVKFLRHRTEGQEIRKLKSIFPGHNYEDWEVAIEDQFKSAYVGKIYRRSGRKLSPGHSPTGDADWNPKDYYATEVLSMGIEQMYRNPFKFWDEDPEYFTYVYRFLIGENPWP